MKVPGHGSEEAVAAAQGGGQDEKGNKIRRPTTNPFSVVRAT